LAYQELFFITKAHTRLSVKRPFTHS